MKFLSNAFIFMVFFGRNHNDVAARRLGEYPELNSIGWTPSETLQLCEGDCDSDNDCAPGLKCFQRDGFTPVPGCSGTGISSYDYCINPELNSIGLTPSETLHLCEGDCDNDDDCAPGLKCFQRTGFTPVPGCNGIGIDTYDYCIYPELKSICLTPTRKLQLCEGDCDNDNDCASGLKCFQRTGFTPVPGCRGKGISTSDYCIYPELNSIGWNPSETLQLCEGHCDNDNDCASGLKCFQRNAFEAVPGCRGIGTYSQDYCVYSPFTITAQVGGNLGGAAARLGQYTFDKMWNGAAAYTNGLYIVFYGGSNDGWQWVTSYNQRAGNGPSLNDVADAQAFVTYMQFQLSTDVVPDYAPFTITAQVGGNLGGDAAARLGQYTFDKMWKGAAAYTNGQYILFYGGSNDGWQWVTGYNKWAGNGPSLNDVADAQAFVTYMQFQLM